MADVDYSCSSRLLLLLFTVVVREVTIEHSSCEMENPMIQIEHENPYRLHTTFYVEVQFPVSFSFEGVEYRRTGKYGVNLKTGVPSAEFRALGQECDRRLWMDANEVITPE